MNFRQKIAQFMYGRNGLDAYGQFLLIAAIGMAVLAMVFSWLPALSVLLQMGEFAVVIYCLWRMFSRNIYKRQQENARYYEKRQAFSRWARGLKERWQQRRDYKFFRCPSCHALLRVPRGKGRLQLTCRKCGNRFERKT